ncbi:MAG TPA: hypothetical protein VD969_27040 [Symbiobacteriaceae bacterium]|nr:hypothetical protein [Symbiobacteriaceae bacterium]
MTRLLALLTLLIAALVDYLRRPRTTARAPGTDRESRERPVA